MRTKLLVIGHKGHGKSHVSSLLAEALNINFMESSTYCLERVIYPILKDKYDYKTIEEALADKDNRRSEWFDIISSYCEPPERLTTEILAEHDIYCGMRSRREFEASNRLFDLTIWVEATERTGDTESINSMQLTKEDADVIIDNNVSKEKLEDVVTILTLTLFKIPLKDILLDDYLRDKTFTSNFEKQLWAKLLPELYADNVIEDNAEEPYKVSGVLLNLNNLNKRKVN